MVGQSEGKIATDYRAVGHFGLVDIIATKIEGELVAFSSNFAIKNKSTQDAYCPFTPFPMRFRDYPNSSESPDSARFTEIGLRHRCLSRTLLSFFSILGNAFSCLIGLISFRGRPLSRTTEKEQAVAKASSHGVGSHDV